MSEHRAAAREVWSGGDYPPIAERLEPAAEALVNAAGVEPGHRVLDVGAGTGNVAIAAARRGADVVASDLTPHLMEMGRRRTGDLQVEWVEADAQELPFEDATFDHVLSAFGAIFAPDPERTAAELVRVARPGGVAALTARRPTGLPAEAMQLMARHLGGGGGDSPWGQPGGAERLLSRHAAHVEVHEHSLHWQFPSPEDYLAFMWEGAPPVVAARRHLDEAAQRALHGDLLALLRDKMPRTRNGVALESPNLIAVARR